MTPEQHRATAKRVLRDTEQTAREYRQRTFSTDTTQRLLGEIANGYARATVHALLALEQPPTG
jgi:hypothetical protein